MSHNPHHFALRRIHADDWDWIETWLLDPVFAAGIAPLDSDWLDFVLNSASGAQLILTYQALPVAMIGCTWAIDAEPFHAITDIAVAPKFRRCGVGKRALACALAWPEQPPADAWLAYVAPDNYAAIQFFTHNGWLYQGLEDAMHRFEYYTRPTALM